MIMKMDVFRKSLLDREDVVSVLSFCCKLNSQSCQEIISSTFKQLQNICEKSLSGTRKHTLE